MDGASNKIVEGRGGRKAASCWCGEGRLEPFDSDYGICPECGTLRVRRMPPARSLVAGENGLYGKSYWFEHQRRQGLPDLEARRRSDITDRGPHWLRALFARRPPPARVLEIGCSHGGFLALLRAAGYEAEGLELSPWVVAEARRSFDVTVHLGMLEEQDWPAGRFDVVVMMDVLEHLPRPLETLKSCAGVLAEGGLLAIQTPQRPPGLGGMDLEEMGHRFREMLLPEEHLFLFTRASVRRLCDQAGFGDPVFLEALFDYDMFLVAGLDGEDPPAHGDATVGAETVSESGDALVWWLRALLETAEQRDTWHRRFLGADSDRRGRAEQVAEMEAAYLQADEDRRQRGKQVATLEGLVAEAESARQEAVRQAEEAALHRREAERRVADHAEQAERRLAEQTEILRDVEDLREEVASLRGQLEDARKRGELAASTIDALAGLLGEQAHRRGAAELEARAWREGYRSLREVDEDHRTSRIYRALVAIGRWRAHDERLVTVLEQTGDVAVSAGSAPVAWALAGGGDAERGPILLDLTALLPGGANGGVKQVALELARRLPRLAPRRRFLLLTGEACHAELADLEQPPRVQRFRLPPGDAEAWATLLDAERPSVLLCPTTAPPFIDPRLPLVCLIPDLQDHTYPQFFSAHERSVRHAHVQRAVDYAHRLVAISDFVRRTLIESAGAAPEQVVTIPLAFGDRLAAADPLPAAAGRPGIVERLGLERGAYLLYPANFWPHKNHAMLLTAFAQLRRRGHGLKLVLTGSTQPDPEPIRRAAHTMKLAGPEPGPTDSVVFAGWVEDAELRDLYDGCRALIFPSLYEGFGMPVIEAMTRGKPVLASSTTALPEVAGKAALLFDPRRPKAIVSAVENLLEDPELERELIRRGEQRAALFADADRMAAHYLEALEQAGRQGPRPGVFGVEPDGWSRSVFGLVWGEAEHGRREVRWTLRSPPLPFPSVLEISDGRETRRLESLGSRPIRLHCRLPAARGVLRLRLETPWSPRGLGLGEDRRQLGVRIDECRLLEDGEAHDLLSGTPAPAAVPIVRHRSDEEARELSFCVVTPSFQQGPFLERTVRSVLEQGLEDLDYVVMDGGSTDDSVEILRRYEDRLRFVSEPDGGQADAVNRGIRATSADLIGWINSDDVYYPGALRTVRRFFAEHPEVDVVYGRADHIDAQDQVIEPYPTEDWDAGRLFETCFLCQPATFFRRRTVERFGLLDPGLQLCMDYELWLRLSLRGARFAYLDDAVLAGSRLYGETKTLGQRRAVHREINHMFRATAGHVPDRWLTNWAHAVLEGGRLSLEHTPVRFATTVSALSWLAALRWNRRISPQLRRQTFGWIKGQLRPGRSSGAGP